MLRKNLSVGLCTFCIVFAPMLNAQSEKWFRWQDDLGQWHYSDKAPVSHESEEQSSADLSVSINSVDWNDAKPIKPVTLKATKGTGALSKKKANCEKLKQQTQRYESLSRKNGDNLNYREKKRAFRWQYLKSCR